jgi:hypothetical protein
VLDSDGSLRQEAANLNRLDQERGEALARQNTNANLTDLSLLPQQYQNIQQRRDDLLRRVRERAQTLNVYEAFVRHHIGGNQMMVSIIDMVNGGNNNFSSVDVIAHINNMGLRVFTLGLDNQIRLSHSYIPQNATEVVNVYHEGVHFEAALPVNDAMATELMQSDSNPNKMEKAEKETEKKVINKKTN